MFSSHYCILTIKIIFYLLGRLCDDFSWYPWSVSPDTLKVIAVIGLVLSAVLTIGQRAFEEDGIKLIFLQSQVRFLIPWALVTLIIILLFNIFGCNSFHTQSTQTNPLYYLDLEGCWLHAFCILLTNLNYSLICNIRGDLAVLGFFEMVLFAEIIYNGTLLLKLLSELEGLPKDYSTLFFSLLIAWQVLTMDLLFRGAYEDKEKQAKHQDLERMVIEYRDILERYRRDEAVGSERLFRSEENNNLNQQKLQGIDFANGEMEYEVQLREMGLQMEHQRVT